MAVKGQRPRWYKNPDIIVKIVVALIGAIALITVALIGIIPQCNSTNPVNLNIKITSPENNASVTNNYFQLKGNAAKEPVENEYLYAIVQEQTLLWWPTKLSVNYTAQSKTYEFNETIWINKTGMDKEIFLVKIITTDEVIHQKFQEWRSNCIARNEWPGIPVDKVNNWGTCQTEAEVTIIY